MTPRRNESVGPGREFPSRRSVLATMSALPVLVSATPVAGASAAVAANVTIDPAAERQTIRGFGGMNHTLWVSDLTAAQRDVAFGNGEGQLGFSVLRIPVHENQADWSREVATAKRAIEHGATVIASPWNPPRTWWRPSSTAVRPMRDGSGTTCTALTRST